MDRTLSRIFIGLIVALWLWGIAVGIEAAATILAGALAQ